MSVHTPPQPLLKHVEQSNLCCRIVTDDRALYQLDSLLETFNIVEDIRSNRLLIQSLRAKNVLANVFGEKDLIQFHDFIIHILQPFQWLKQLSCFNESIQFLHSWHTTRKSNEQSANIPLAEHAIIHTRPFKWRPGDHPNALRYELLERGQLPRRFVGPLKEVGSYLFDACALLMVYRILGDGSLSIFDCKEETKRFLKAYHLRYVEINEEEVLTDLETITGPLACAISLTTLPRLEAAKLSDVAYMRERMAEMNDPLAVLKFGPSEQQHAVSLTHLIQCIEQIPYKAMAKARCDEILQLLPTAMPEYGHRTFEYPYESGNQYTYWTTVTDFILPLLIFTPKNERLVPNIEATSAAVPSKVVQADLNAPAMLLLQFLQQNFPHKHGEPGLEEDHQIHLFLTLESYDPYIKAKEKQQWLQGKMAYLAKRELVEQIYDKKKRNYWYSWPASAF